MWLPKRYQLADTTSNQGIKEKRGGKLYQEAKSRSDSEVWEKLEGVIKKKKKKDLKWGWGKSTLAKTDCTWQPKQNPIVTVYPKQYDLVFLNSMARHDHTDSVLWMELHTMRRVRGWVGVKGRECILVKMGDGTRTITLSLEWKANYLFKTISKTHTRTQAHIHARARKMSNVNQCCHSEKRVRVKCQSMLVRSCPSARSLHRFTVIPLSLTQTHRAWNGTFSFISVTYKETQMTFRLILCRRRNLCSNCLLSVAKAS